MLARSGPFEGPEVVLMPAEEPAVDHNDANISPPPESVAGFETGLPSEAATVEEPYAGCRGVKEAFVERPLEGDVTGGALIAAGTEVK